MKTISNRIKLTCQGCRAYDYKNSSDRICSLGYYQENGKPQEPCPKPKTIRHLIDAPVANA